MDYETTGGSIDGRLLEAMMQARSVCQSSIPMCLEYQQLPRQQHKYWLSRFWKGSVKLSIFMIMNPTIETLSPLGALTAQSPIAERG
jgi:hypothetical protein